MSTVQGLCLSDKGILTLNASMTPQEVEVTFNDIHLLCEGLLDNWSKVHIQTNVPLKEEEEKRRHKIRDKYEKAWRKDKLLLMTPEEEDAYAQTYMFNLLGSNWYGSWVRLLGGNPIFRLDISGEICSRFNIFVSDWERDLTPEETINEIVAYLRGNK